MLALEPAPPSTNSNASASGSRRAHPSLPEAAAAAEIANRGAASAVTGWRSPSDAIAAPLLGLVEALVGALVEDLPCFFVSAESGYANADSAPDVDLLVPDEHRLDYPPYLLGGFHRTLERNLGQEHPELLAAGARKDIFPPEPGLHGRRKLPQDVVARQMPVAVVYVLEVIDIERNERKDALVALRPIELTLERLVEIPAIVRLRKTVDGHEAVDFLVIVNLDILAGHKLEDRSPYPDLVAVA